MGALTEHVFCEYIIYMVSALKLSLLSILFYILLVPVAFAQSVVSVGIANYVPVKGEDVRDGAIISFDSKGYKLSSGPFDSSIIGVIGFTPAISLDMGDAGTYPVVSSGNAIVNASMEGGAIKKGDLIAASSAPGVGMKATKSGMVLGTAQEDYNSSDPKKVGRVAVNLNIQYFTFKERGGAIKRSLADIANLSAIAATEAPSVVFRYVLAAIVIVISILLGFASFVKTANNGVRALGRNPLAGKMIELGILLNVLITFIIVGAGVSIAYLVIRL